RIRRVNDRRAVARYETVALVTLENLEAIERSLERLCGYRQQANEALGDDLDARGVGSRDVAVEAQMHALARRDDEREGVVGGIDAVQTDNAQIASRLHHTGAVEGIVLEDHQGVEQLSPGLPLDRREPDMLMRQHPALATLD